MPLATDEKSYPEWFYIVLKDLLLDNWNASLREVFLLQNKIIKEFELKLSARQKCTDTLPTL